MLEDSDLLGIARLLVFSELRPKPGLSGEQNVFRALVYRFELDSTWTGDGAWLDGSPGTDWRAAEARRCCVLREAADRAGCFA